jgi:hypothetical protein
MSFLLDALGKADHDRRRAEVPELRTFRSGDRSTLRRVLSVLLLAGLIIFAFALGYLLRPVLEPVLSGTQSVRLASAPLIETAIIEPLEHPATVPPVKNSVRLEQAASLPVLEVISYSIKPAGRFAMIDGTLLYEGDTLHSGETLLSIEQDAVVIDREGQQIRLSM